MLAIRIHLATGFILVKLSATTPSPGPRLFNVATTEAKAESNANADTQNGDYTPTKRRIVPIVIKLYSGLEGELVTYGNLEYAVLVVAVLIYLGEAPVVTAVDDNIVKLVRDTDWNREVYSLGVYACGDS